MGIIEKNIKWFYSVILLLYAGCSPCFNTLQTARMLPPKTVEFTPSVSWFSELDPESLWYQRCYGGRLGIGLTPKINLYGHYGVVVYGLQDDEKSHYTLNITALGLKLDMTKPADNKTRGALYIPVGTCFKKITDRLDLIVIQPTMILTRPVTKRLDLLFSTVFSFTKIQGSHGIGKFAAQNIGLDVNLFVKGLSLRPEIGIGVAEGGGKAWQYSIALSYAPSGYIK